MDLKERPDTGVYVKDLSSFIAKSVKEIEHVMSIGNQNRAVGYDMYTCTLYMHTMYMHVFIPHRHTGTCTCMSMWDVILLIK